MAGSVAVMLIIQVKDYPTTLEYSGTDLQIKGSDWLSFRLGTSYKYQATEFKEGMTKQGHLKILNSQYWGAVTRNVEI